MNTRFARCVGVAGLVLCAVTAVRTAKPTFWTVSTQADFLKGEVDALSIDSIGRLTLGPATALMAETTAPALWAIEPAAGGGYWLGSGNDGRVLRVDASGAVTTFFDSPELQVHALATGPGGSLYAATSPDGKIYRLAPDGTASVAFDPDDTYIWSLAMGPGGELYAGTGEKGLIYRLEADGRVRTFYDTKTTHVVSLAVDPEGRLLAGTASPGRVFRIDGDGKGFVLIDSPFKEIHSLRIDARGVIYAVAVDGKEEPQAAVGPGAVPDAPRPPPVPSVSTEITTFAIVEPGVAARTGAARARLESAAPRKGAVYRIMPDGVWETVWQSSEDTPFDVAVDLPGGLLIGTGGSGKLFQVIGEPARITLVTRAPAQQVTRLLRRPDGQVVAVTSNPGKVFALSQQPARAGTYLSDVLDATTVASWGTIRWRANGGGTIAISTRSGNTSTADDTWSDWSTPYRDAAGDLIVSPKARYLQWRAVLTAGEGSGPGPFLTSVMAAYLPRNQKPVVAGVTVHPPGTVFQRPFPTGEVVELAGFDSTPVDGRPGVGPPTAVGGQPPLGRRLHQKGLQTFAWTATDPDDDTLLFDVFYRRDDETEWKVLKRGLWEPIVVWDTTSVPDGSYTVRIVASDAPTNAPGSALAGETESVTFDVDNTPPRIDIEPPRRDPRGVVLEFVVRDDHSAVERVEYSVEAERWKPIYPKDGLPDSRVEQFELVLEGDAAARSVIIRATDAMGNVATAASRRRP